MALETLHNSLSIWQFIDKSNPEILLLLQDTVILRQCLMQGDLQSILLLPIVSNFLSDVPAGIATHSLP